MPYGYTGNILHLDLSSKKHWIEHPSENFYRTYWGGRALAFNMAHIYNYREGFTFKGDLLDGQGATNKKDFEKAIKLRYELMGWNADTGIPTPAKLIELGLDWLIDEVK